MISGVDEYLHASVMTATPHRLHLMVVDAALRQARQAVESLEAGDFMRAHETCSKARECINELLGGLREEAAPELIGLVRDFLLHIQKCLNFADLFQDLEAARKALELLESYRGTWVELREKIAS